MEYLISRNGLSPREQASILPVQYSNTPSLQYSTSLLEASS